MSALIEVILTVESHGAPLAAEVVEQTLDSLDSRLGLVPTAFGTHEPLQHKFDQAARRTFVEMWSETVRAGSAGGFHFRAGRTLTGAVLNLPGGHIQSLHLNFSLAASFVSSKAEALVGMARDVFTAGRGSFGFLCERDEYWSKNIEGAWRNSAGRLQGGRALVIDRRRFLPGVYWVNFFGEPLVGKFSATRLRTAPAVRAEEFGASWMLQSANRMLDWEQPESVARCTAIAEHLGADAFWDRQRA